MLALQPDSKVNSVLCVQCGKSIHDGHAAVKKANPQFSINFYVLRRALDVEVEGQK